LNLSLFIARRYLFSKKSHNVINVISGISVAGIALASFALICALSVFNGFHDLVATLFTDFDPELKVVAANSKVFDSKSPSIESLCNNSDVETYSFSIEDQALIQYKSHQEIAVIKGVEDSFYDLANVENTLIGSGIFMLKDEVCEYGIMGIGLASRLDCGVQSVSPFTLFVPKRGARVNMINPAANFNSAEIFSPGVLFQVNQQKYDDSYVIISLQLAKKLLGYTDQVSSVEIKLKEGVSVRKAKREFASMLGPDYKVMDRYEQQADVFKIVNLEKFITYVFLTFILFIASFNIIGSLIMLMVEKQQDSLLLRNLGAETGTISKVFLYEGLLISLFGALIGLSLGTIFALLQQTFGFIPMGTSGGFVVDSYPVSVRFRDILLVLTTVSVVSYLSVKPINKIAARFIKRED
jgi:lipoprotein-releasing system permease protein